jgi:hypothetical protein
MRNDLTDLFKSNAKKGSPCSIAPAFTLNAEHD